MRDLRRPPWALTELLLTEISQVYGDCETQDIIVRINRDDGVTSTSELNGDKCIASASYMSV